MPRRDPGTPTQVTPIRPAARPVNTFVQQIAPPNFLGAGAIGPSAGSQLAKSLSSFAPKLQRFAEDERARKSEADLAAGKLAAMTTALNSKEAIEKGLIRATESPFFMQGFNEQRGRVAGTGAKIALFDAYRNFEGRNSNDPAVFQSFLSEFRQQQVESAGGNAAFLQGMLPGIREAEQQIIGKHLKFTDKRIMDEVQTNTSVEFSRSVDDALVAEGDLDLDALNLELNLTAARQSFLGISRAHLNELVVEAVIAKSLETGNPDVLDVLTMARPDGTPGPGKTGKNTKLIQAARQTLIARVNRDDLAYYRNKDRVEKDAADDLYIGFVQGIVADPATDVNLSSPEMRAGAALDRNFQADVLSFQAAIRANVRDENPKDVAALFGLIYSTVDPLTMSQLVRSVSTGTLYSPKTIELAARAIVRQRGRNIGDNAAMKFVLPRLERSAIGNEVDLNRTSLDTGTNAYIDLILAFDVWESENPDAPFPEQLTEARRLKDLILGAVNPDALAPTP